VLLVCFCGIRNTRKWCLAGLCIVKFWSSTTLSGWLMAYSPRPEQSPPHLLLGVPGGFVPGGIVVGRYRRSVRYRRNWNKADVCSWRGEIVLTGNGGAGSPPPAVGYCWCWCLCRVTGVGGYRCGDGSTCDVRGEGSSRGQLKNPKMCSCKHLIFVLRDSNLQED